MSEVRRILFINSVPDVGGAEASMLDLMAHLDREHYHATLVTTEAGRLSDDADHRGVNVHYADFPFFSRRRPWIYGRAILRLINLIRAEKIDLVHVNCDRAVPHAVLAARLAGVKVICHIHDMVRAWFLPSYVRWLNRADRIIADSQATARYCVPAGMCRQKIQVIYECFEFARYAHVEADCHRKLRAEWGVPENAVLIGLVGHVLRYKGHQEFVEAARQVVAQNEDAYFVIVGDDHMSDEHDFLPSLKNFVASNSLAERVYFAGFRSDIPQVMSAMDILAVPSWTEAFGRVAVEGLASRLPVVATRVGGIPEVVENEVTGILIMPRSADELAGALLRLVQNPDLRCQMGERGPQAAQRFDVMLHARLFEQTYQGVISGQTAHLPRVPFGTADF